ncbi:MAG: ArsC family reductase [Gammaproteobacteria bacterium]|nr:ArsC family reductase [Gammaproteobacteria bacterium]MCK5091470.1 ArsC family reductase [Gammaproteobacteria bacterium]
MILYGISNCDTIKKARKWLDANDIEYQFHDYRKNGLDTKLLKRWAKELDWESLLNRRGTTWRKIPEAEREAINEKNAITLMLKHPAMIKRPLLDTGNTRVVGFKEEEYSELFL